MRTISIRTLERATYAWWIAVALAIALSSCAVRGRQYHKPKFEQTS